MSFPDPRRADARGLVAVAATCPWPGCWPRIAAEFFRGRSGPSVGGRRTLARFSSLKNSGFQKVWTSDPAGVFEVTMDRAFGEVMRGCAASAAGREAPGSRPNSSRYTRLHEAGHAHSMNAAQRAACGWVYGVASGGLFAGESMFHTKAMLQGRAGPSGRAFAAAKIHAVRHPMLTPVTRNWAP